MPQTIRVYWGSVGGRATLNFNWPIIDQDSVVLITASEYAPSDPHTGSGPRRFIGAANITVDNIDPHGPPFDPNHGVTFVVNVDWPSALSVATDITVLDAKPIEVDPGPPPPPPTPPPTPRPTPPPPPEDDDSGWGDDDDDDDEDDEGEEG